MKKYKTVLVIIFCLVFFFISVYFLSIDRKYSFIENAFKSFSSKINSYIIKKTYGKNSTSKNVSNSKIIELENENKKLKNMLGLVNKDNKCENAEVINRRLSRLEINKGSKNGVVLGSPVLNEKGLVGIVSKIGFETSEVRLIKDYSDDNPLLVMINNDQEKISGILTGYLKNKNYLVITNVNSKSKIDVSSDVLLSSYYKNGAYDMIPIGKVKVIGESNQGLTTKLYVEPAVDFDNLLFLCVEVQND